MANLRKMDNIKTKNNNIFLGDYKSKLQELVQTTKKSLEYRLISESGPGHDKVFEVEVVIIDEEKHSYENYVREEIEGIILNSQLAYLKNIRGGIFHLLFFRVYIVFY